MQHILIFTLLAFPSVAHANSMAPVFPLLSIYGWVAMPLIILIEAQIYKRTSINNPYKLSIYSNIASAALGLLLAGITFPVMIGPPIEPYPEVIYPGAIITFLAIIIHWWLSSFIEYKFSKWHTIWRDKGIKLSTFYKANGLTYALIFVIFAVNIMRLLIQYHAKS